MKRTDQLKQTIERLTQIYNDGETVPVKWTNRTPYAALDGSHIGMNPERGAKLFDPKGPDELRLLADTTSHEVEHIRSSDLTSKKQMADAHPDHSTVAGAIANIFEDDFVDHNRTDRFPGLRGTLAWVLEKWQSKRDSVDSLQMDTLRYWEVLQQVAFTGDAKGLDNVAEPGDDLYDFARYIADRARAVRTMTDQGERQALFEEVFDVLGERVDLDALEDQITDDDVRFVVDPKYVDGLPEDTSGEPGDLPGLGTLSGGDVGDWWDVPADFDLDEDTDRTWAATYVDLLEAEQANAQPIDDRMAEREKTIKRAAKHTSHEGHSSRIRARVERLGIAEDVAEFFQRFKQGDHHVATDRGNRLNTDAAIQAVAGSYVRDLYEEVQEVELGDRAVAVTVDLSGSMSGKALTEAKTALAAVALATQEIGDDFVSSGFEESGSRGDADDIHLPLGTAPGEEFEWEHLDALTGGGGTPTTSGMMDAKRLLDMTSGRKQILIVLTDGKPNSPSGIHPNLERGGAYDSNDLIDEAHSYVQRLRGDGVTVIGLALGGSIDRGTMTAMFGEGWRRTSADDLSDTLIDIYADLMDVER